ncbi:hypothetical protein ANMWB30_24350 [Arthrobacter sp. MWB30]|nr:hypothetical protein ANMWB30_24350 [Arthrobacter sp. MWB30]
MRYWDKLYTPVREFLLTGQFLGRRPDLNFRRTYIEHTCRPEDLSNHSELARKVTEALKQLIEDNPPQWAPHDLKRAAETARDRQKTLRELIFWHGLTRECPRCGAGTGEPCENLSERKRGNTITTKNPHDERIPLPETVEASELERAREETTEAYGLLHQIRDALATDDALQKLVRLAEQY